MNYLLYRALHQSWYSHPQDQDCFHFCSSKCVIALASCTPQSHLLYGWVCLCAKQNGNHGLCLAYRKSDMLPLSYYAAILILVNKRSYPDWLDFDKWHLLWPIWSWGRKTPWQQKIQTDGSHQKNEIYCKPYFVCIFLSNFFERSDLKLKHIHR